MTSRADSVTYSGCLGPRIILFSLLDCVTSVLPPATTDCSLLEVGSLHPASPPLVGGDCSLLEVGLLHPPSLPLVSDAGDVVDDKLGGVPTV